MNSNDLGNWHEYPLEKVDYRQPQLLHPVVSELSKPEQFQFLPNNRAEVEWLRALYNSLPCICFTLSSTGIILAASQFGAAYLGYDAEELTQMPIASIFHREDQVRGQAQLTELQQQPTQIRQWEARQVCKNGSIIWVRAIARLLPGTESNPLISLVCEDITAYKQLEETLRSSEQLHRNTLTSISDAVFITNDSGAFTFICPNVHTIFGYSWQEVCEMGAIDTLLGKLVLDWQELETCGEICNIEQEITDKTGRQHTLLVNVKRVSIQDGTVLYSCRDVTDLTDLKRTQEILRESEERFRATFEQAAVGISHCDLNGQFLRVNRKFCEIVGYSQEELRSRTFQDITFPGDLVASTNNVRSLLVDEISCYEVEKRYIRKDGAIIWGHQTVSLVREPTGEPKYFVAVVEDISDAYRQATQRKQVEEALRESEQRFRTMADSAPVLLWMSDTNGLCTFFNQIWLNFTGRSLEQEMGNGWIEGVHPDDVQDYLKSYLSAFNTHQEFQLEYRLKRADNEYQWILDTGSPRFTPNGSFLGYIGSCLDITERKQAEQALQQQFLRERLIGMIAGRIHESLNLEKTLNTTVAEIRQFLDCDRVIIFRLHPDGSGVVVVESVDSNWMAISGVTINDRYFAEIYVDLYRQGRVQAVEDVYAAGLTECHINLLAQFQVRANLVIPIVQEENLWGLLVAQQCRDTREWQSWEIDLLKSLATQAAIAIQQSELYQQAEVEIAQRQQAEAALRQQVQREQLIGAIAQRIRQSLNLEEILNSTVAEVRQVLQTDRVIIFQFESDWSGYVAVESVSESFPAILGTNIYDHCFEQAYVLPYQEGRVKATEDIYATNLSQCHIDLLAQFQVRANLVVPILQSEPTLSNSPSSSRGGAKTQNHLWGLLVAHHCSEPRHWQQFEMDLLCSLASQVAIAIQQSQLYEQAQSQAKRERALNQVTQAIRSSLNLNTVFETAVCQIGELLQVDRVKIVQYLPERQCWLHVAEYCKSEDAPTSLGEEIPDDNNPIAERLKRLEIVRIHDTHTLNDEINKGLAEVFPGAWLMVPLHFGSRILGSLTLARGVSPYHWQDSEVELIRGVADQVAIAIQQSQLYQQAQYHFLREQALNQLTQAIRRSLDLQTIFSTATHEIEQLLKVDRVQIIQYLPEQKVWVNVAESCKGTCLPVGLGFTIPDENNPIAERLKRLEVVRINDTTSFEDEINRSIGQKFPGAWLLTPLHFGSTLWGSLGLVMDVGPYHWQESQVELIGEVADQLAIALQQAELYQQSRAATTRAITQAEQLEQALQELQRTQAQLVQSEKMSSLGQLVAGVAHEINNPVSFIYGNLMHAGGYTQDILRLLKLYEEYYPDPVPAIRSEIKAMDLDFLAEDLPKLLDSMKVGAERICEIISSLRTFSRVCEAEIKAVDIHGGLDSTLTILQNRLKAQGKRPGIQVIKEYGNLPKVECYAGQLNQVFMNLLTNAIDALEGSGVRSQESGGVGAGLTQISAFPQINPVNPSVQESGVSESTTDFQPMIRICTELLNENQVVIRIADNGLGISESVKARIFDPFFTTKPVGVGTGLGLSISYQIVVEKHGGQLHCISDRRQGTEFVIQIPLSQSTQ